LIVPVYFFRTIPLADKKRIFVLGRKIAVGFDYTFYLNGKPGRLGNYVVDAYIFNQSPTAEEFEILLEDAAAGSNHFIPISPVPSIDNVEMKEISLGHNPTLPVEEKSFRAVSTPPISSQAIDLLFAFIQSRKEGKPVLVKTDVSTPPILMVQLAQLVPQKQIENLTFVTNHTEEGKKKGINIAFINEYYGFEIFRKQWVWLDLEGEAAAPTPEALLFRERVEEYVEKGDLQSVHNLVGWCLSDMYEKGKLFPEETQAQLYNYLYDFQNFNLERVAADKNLRQTLNDYFISDAEEKVRFDEELQHRFHSLKTIDDLWRWIDLVISLNPIDCKGIIEKNRLVVTSAVFESPKTFLQFYTHYRNRFGDVQKFIDKEAFASHQEFLSDEVLRPVWQQLYTFFLKDRLEEENKDYLVERMIHDNLDIVSLQQVLNKERISAKEYINCLVTILAKHDDANERQVAFMLAEALKDRNDIEIDFFERFPDKISDYSYTPLYEWQLRNYSLKTKERIEKLTEYLLRFKSNDGAAEWAFKGEGGKVFVRLYSALKDAMKHSRISQKEVMDICDDLRKSGYDSKNTDAFNILDTIARREEVKDMKRIRKIWEVAAEIGDKEYLKTLIPSMAANVILTGNDSNIDNFCKYLIDIDLIDKNQLWEFAGKTDRPEPFRVAVVRYGFPKAQEKHDFLLNERGMTDEQAISFLEINFPKDYEAIMKSREPSMFQKLAGKIKGLFGKKDKKEE
ncbi:MAG: hypothetical protein K2J48_07500, partial [Muribaculaceae bacterium]|nr:hypothetical protein [Muribaculaceae bacterium]